jgi:hypothetical protein
MPSLQATGGINAIARIGRSCASSAPGPAYLAFLARLKPCPPTRTSGDARAYIANSRFLSAEARSE